MAEVSEGGDLVADELEASDSGLLSANGRDFRGRLSFSFCTPNIAGWNWNSKELGLERAVGERASIMKPESCSAVAGEN